MRILLPVFCLFLAATPALAGVDARTQEGSQRKFFCVAYSLVGNWADWKAGKIDEKRYHHQKNQITWKIYDKSDNHNYAPDRRKVERAFEAIAASDPSSQDIADTAAYCRGFLHL